MKIVHGAASDVGLVRHQNEDSFVVGGGIYAVCDGMGGARGGEVASATACRRLASLAGTDSGTAELVREIETANTLILHQSRRDPVVAGMGSTLTAARVRGDTLIIAHVGDSRAYLLREGELRQLTRDHSMVAEMERRGQLTRAEAAVHPFRSVLTRAVGTEEPLEVDVFEEQLSPGDKVLLCSDGLTGMVDEEEIARLLVGSEDPQETAEALLRAAVDAGGEDNVTVVVLHAVEGEPDDGAAAAEAVIGPGDRADSFGSAVDSSEGSGEDSDPAGAAGAEGTEEAAGRPDDSPGPAASSDAESLEADDALAGPPGPKVVGLEEREPKVRPERRWAIVAVVIVVMIALLAGAFLVFNSTVYFVGAEDGNVVLFQGLPYTVLGVRLYEVEETTGNRYEDLEPYLRERVDAHELTTKEEGLRFIRGLAAER